MSAATTAIEARHISVMKGVKQGAIKGVVDKVVDTMAGPISEAIMKNLTAGHPTIQVLEPAVRAALSFIFIMGIAELMVFAAPMAGKVVPALGTDSAAEKSQLLAQWMRQYAGEKIGEEVITAAVSVFPLVMAQFSAISSDDLKIVLDEPVVAGTASDQAVVVSDKVNINESIKV